LSVTGAVYVGSQFTAQALIDTGATTTCLSHKAIETLGLQPVGKVQVHGVAGIAEHNSYLFKIGFPFMFAPNIPLPPDLPPPQPGELPSTLHTLEVVLQGSEFDATNANFDILLGMDVISTGCLVVSGNGTYGLSF
jgi:hypothetical protein